MCMNILHDVASSQAIITVQAMLCKSDGDFLQREAWEAAPISCRAAVELFGADKAHPMSQV